MSGRRLRWVPGPPSGGVVYFMRAWHNEVEFSVAKFVVDGVERFGLWKAKVLQEIFDRRLDALNRAEELL